MRLRPTISTTTISASDAGRLIHGSPANTSNIRRCGYTMRYVSTRVRFNHEKHQWIHLYLARGKQQDALDALVEVVVPQHAVLHDADGGGRSRERDEHRHQRGGAIARGQTIGERHDDEQHELLAVDQARARVGGEGRRHEREPRIREQRPEEPRDVDALAPHDDERQPARDGDREQDLRRRNRELQRTCHAVQRDGSGELEPVVANRMRRVERDGVSVAHAPGICLAFSFRNSQ